MSRWIVALCCAVLIAGSLSAQSRKSPTSSGLSRGAAAARSVDQPTGIISLSACRIRLIDVVELAADRAGILKYVAEEGRAVRAGDVTAHLRDDLVRAALAIAEREAQDDTDVRYAKKSSDLEQLKYLRSVKANQRVAGTVSDLALRSQRLAAEKSLLQYEQSRNTHAIKRLKRDQTRTELETYFVKAPFSALVREVHKKRGEAVREGETILEIVNTQRIRVEGEVGIADAARISPGMPVQVRLEIPHQELDVERQVLTGRIIFVDVKVEPVSRKIKVVAHVANPRGLLKEGLLARMTIDTAVPIRRGVASTRRRDQSELGSQPYRR